MEKFQVPHPPPRLCTNPLTVKHPITIQDGGIQNLIYLLFCSKITPGLQVISHIGQDNKMQKFTSCKIKKKYYTGDFRTTSFKHGIFLVKFHSSLHQSKLFFQKQLEVDNVNSIDQYGYIKIGLLP